MKRVCILGSTGSIGSQTLDVLRRLNPEESPYPVVALAAGRNLETLAQQIVEFRPPWVCIQREQDLRSLQRLLGRSSNATRLVAGDEGLQALVAESGADICVNGLVGAAGLRPTLAALDAGVDVALANKESLVIGGHLVAQALQRADARLIPVDSEHNALFQLLESLPRGDISRVVLTASGGALRDVPLEKLNDVTPDDVLAHPTWRMGPRITVDSATLVNKGFEVIEARWLFEMPFERIQAVIHPQSLVHGLVELVDGGLRAYMSPPDMREPIQHALFYPERPPQRFQSLDWEALQLQLEFRRLDPRRYPAFGVVVEAGRSGGTAPAVANAADEVLVKRFLEGEIPYSRLASALEELLERHDVVREPGLPEVIEADRWARERAAEC